MHLCCYETKVPNLELKTQPKQLLGYLLLDTVPLVVTPSGSATGFSPFYSNNINQSYILIQCYQKTLFLSSLLMFLTNKLDCLCLDSLMFAFMAGVYTYIFILSVA